MPVDGRENMPDRFVIRLFVDLVVICENIQR